MLDNVKRRLAAGFLIFALLLLMSWVQGRDMRDVQLASAACTPTDYNEVAIQTRINGRIFCEKHPRIPELACPIKDACTFENLEKTQ